MWPFKEKINNPPEELVKECEKLDNDSIWKPYWQDEENFFRECRSTYFPHFYVHSREWSCSFGSEFRCKVTKEYCEDGDCRYCRIATIADERIFPKTKREPK